MGKTVHFVLHSPFPNYTGGRETWLYNVASRLAAAECPVRIYTTLNDQLPKSFEFKNPYVEILRVKTLVTYSFFRNILRSYLITFDFIVFTLVVLIALRKRVAPNDVVIALGPEEESLAASWLRRTRACKFVCSVRGFHAAVLTREYPLFRKLWYALERRGLMNADRIWCNGYDTLEYVRAMGLQAELMPNGVDLSHYMKDELEITPEFEWDRSLFSDRDKRYIVSTATLLPIKGVKELVDAACVLKQRAVKGWQIIWVGKGNPETYLEYARLQGVKDNILFVGERRDTAPYLRAADIVACLSGGGGLSMALLEAMASGKAIVAWDNGVYRQLLRHNESALLVEEHNSAKLADTLAELVNKYDQYTRLGAAAQKAVLPFDWHAVAEQVRREIDAEEGTR